MSAVDRLLALDTAAPMNEKYVIVAGRPRLWPAI
jgi:hypothetical protein